MTKITRLVIKWGTREEGGGLKEAVSYGGKMEGKEQISAKSSREREGALR